MSERDAHRLDRRTFMAGVVAAALAGTAAACSSGDDGGSGGGGGGAGDSRAQSAPDLPPVPEGLPAEVFALGVASGDPLADSVILWTRIVADPQAEDGGVGAEPVPVGWEVASDEAFEDVVSSGGVAADAALAHSVHVDAGSLEPDTWYWYRFTVGDRVSPAGRARTAPAEGADADRLRFAFASCQNRQDGYWTAHAHLAEEDVDLVLFLGDYIYEEGTNDGSVQPYVSPTPVDLATFRQRWGEYKADPDLQAAHHARPWVVTWDDHEVANDYADDHPEEDGPLADVSSDEWRARRAAAYQAYYEHMPLRLDPPDDADYRIHRAVGWGRLARFYVLDGRQYRSDQACVDTAVVASAGPVCDEAESDDRTMLGDDQESWLGEALGDSDATWNVLAQQTVVSATPFTEGLVNLDQWDGYPAPRRRLVEDLRDVDNPVIITGDIHLAGVASLTDDPDDPDSDPVAVELVGTSISSDFPAALAPVVEAMVDSRANVHYIDARRRGYVVCEVTAGEIRAEYRYVSTTAEPEAEVETGATWVVSAGDPVPRSA
jgi:alkaline phosphatase D